MTRRSSASTDLKTIKLLTKYNACEYQILEKNDRSGVSVFSRPRQRERERGLLVLTEPSS